MPFRSEMKEDGEEEGQSVNIENTGKSATVLCVQYLMSKHMKGKNLIKKEDLTKTVFKGRVIGKNNYDRVMEDVSNTLKNIFGFSLSYIKDDGKQFMIVNNIEPINDPEVHYSFSESSKYRTLIELITCALVMLQSEISEGQMWNILERYSNEHNLDMNMIKKVVRIDLVKDQYLQYKATDDSNIMLDPEKTTHWFSLGPRALVECNQIMLLKRVGELYNMPPESFKRVYAVVHKKHQVIS
ncbi:MAGE homology domain [Cinara cedri]|uniref:MAGE homology domain n=1 Tax=Cinara cedri TaxID=506608 RepID=A0A5E4NGC4_9HEMI|nr:MAGE homology domain [Cinara cedri]